MTRIWSASVAALVAIFVLAAPTGAAGGPNLIRNIRAGAAGSNPASLTQVGGTLFFTANDGIHGRELWKSDGTAAGTKLVKDIRVGAKGSNPTYLTNVNGTLFFQANNGTSLGLWKSDGTRAGTVRIKEPVLNQPETIQCPGDMYYAPVVVGSRLFYFETGGGCALTINLYVTDGSAAGTRYLDKAEVGDLEQGVAGIGLGNKLFFLGYDGVWVSDGTNAGTHRLAGQPAPDSCQTTLLPAHGTKVYFTCSTINSIRLWRTDGTKAGTWPITTTGQLRSVPDEAILMGNRLYFGSTYFDDTAQQQYALLWRTDGTAAGTIGIMNVPGSPVEELMSSGGRLFFRLGSSLWMSDGSMGSAVSLGMPGGRTAEALTDVGGTLCFIETNSDGDSWSLWEREGAGTTNSVKSFASPPGHFERATVNGRLYFAADDGLHGTELWSYTP